MARREGEWHVEGKTWRRLQYDKGASAILGEAETGLAVAVIKIRPFCIQRIDKNIPGCYLYFACNENETLPTWRQIVKGEV